MKGLLLGLATLFVFSTEVKAQAAGLFVEPSVTWENGSGDITFPAPYNNTEADIDGFGLGMRLGMHVMDTVFLGIDGRYSFLNFQEDRSGTDVDANAYNIGPVVGIQMPTPIGLRVWAGYILTSEIDPDRSQDVDVKLESGQGYRIGAGIKLGISSLNAEYQNINYSNTRVESVGSFTPGAVSQDTEMKYEALVLSVSFPLAI